MLNWSALGSMLFPNLGGWAGALTMAGQTKQPDGKAWYQTLKKPSWTPPNWVFGPAWTALYTGMGYASYMVYRDCGGMTGWAGALTMAGQTKQPDGKAWYQTLKKPSWTPPNWVFGPAWTALYTGMGYASYMVYRDCGGMTDKAILPMALYGGQLIFNWTWTPVFFKMHLIGLAFFHMLALDAAAAACTLSFYEINPSTACFMLPYLGWLSFATCLNYSIWQLNKTDEKKN